MSRNLTPLRYPGGKSKLYKYTKKLIKKNKLKGCTYAEGYAGGCGLALELLFKKDVNSIILNDIDRSIYAFWITVLNEGEKLIEKINSTEINMEEWYKQKEIQNNKEDASLYELGFSTFFLNRTNYSGIINAGPIGGYEQKGNYKLNCRFKKDDLIDKIKSIYDMRNSISFYNKDALDFLDILKNKNIDDLFIFLDPPYFEKGPGLYTNFYTESDHRELENYVNKLENNWVVTYDNADIIKKIYGKHKHQEYTLHYSAKKVYKGTEVMFYSPKIVPVNF